MRSATLALILFSLFPRTSLAGQVYGTLRDSGKPVGANIKVEIICGKLRRRNNKRQRHRQDKECPPRDGSDPCDCEWI
jgi:hypothetical protein